MKDLEKRISWIKNEGYKVHDCHKSALAYLKSKYPVNSYDDNWDGFSDTSSLCNVVDIIDILNSNHC